MDEIREKLRSDEHALDVFDTRLAQLGLHEGLRQTGALLKFNFRDVYVFEVAGAFSRLPDGYVPPLGVTSIKYSINLCNLPSLDVTDVRHILNV
ncbi:MAG: PD-(D/E)XK motif protein [Comamonadaceae bacterium]|nr:PD-(D/E)XK motif protein [Comamonadaceae bacterium]